MPRKPPDEDRLIEKTVLKPFDFGPEVMNECHRKMWYLYPEDRYFRFLFIRGLLRELQVDLGASAAETTVQLHRSETGNREIFAFVQERLLYAAIMLDDNCDHVEALRGEAGKRYVDIDRAMKLLGWYRDKARGKGWLETAKGLRAMMKFIMNLPGNPSVFAVPSTNKTLAIQVIWKERDDQEAVTITITDPEHFVF